MKKTLVLFLIAVLGASLSFAQTTSPSNNKSRPHNPRPHNPVPYVVKDECFGHKLNFGFSFAPTLNWMYPATTGFERDGMCIGMRYGININVNLTPRKSYYVSTGFFMEQLGGKMKFLDNITIPIGNHTISTTDIRRRYNAHYLTIPVGITLKTKSLRDFFVIGNFGLYNSFLLQATNSDTYAFTNHQTGDPEYWTRQKTQSTEAAIMKETAYAGLGLEYSITRNFRTGFTINYAHSLTNYFKGRGKAQNNFTGEDQIAKLGYLELVLNINFL